MNTATKNLEDDHVHILKLIDVMDKISASNDPDTTHIENVVDIIKNFADGIHHAKEEKLLFPLLAQRGFSLSQGPVAVMLNEHLQGRNFVKGIVDNIALYKIGNTGVLNAIYYNMNGYGELLRNHISKENNILFRMADRALSESDNKNLLIGFKEAEENNAGPFNHDEYLKQIDKLTLLYGLKS
jgi:hemerythrin-like domain-containing protein